LCWDAAIGHDHEWLSHSTGLQVLNGSVIGSHKAHITEDRLRRYRLFVDEELIRFVEFTVANFGCDPMFYEVLAWG